MEYFLEKILVFKDRGIFYKMLAYLLFLFPFCMFQILDFGTFSVNDGKAFYYYLFISSQQITLIASFFFLSSGLKKGIYLNIKWFILYAVSLFLLFEFYLYYFLKFLNGIAGIATFERWYKVMGNLEWWQIPFSRGVIFNTTSLNIYYLIIPFSVRLIYELFLFVYKNSELQKDNLRLELDFLRAQINPHFFFNTLNNVYSLVSDNEDAAKSIVRLSDLMRYSLYESDKEKVDLAREIEFLQNYIDLEKLRLNKRKTIDFIVEGDFHNIQFPPLLLLTFIENAFKHGINATVGSSWLRVEIKVKAKHLSFMVENSLPKITGITDSKKVGGIGLVNTRKRLNIFYPNGLHRLFISNQLDKFVVQLEIEL